MKIHLKKIGSIIIVAGFLILGFGSDDSDKSPQEERDSALEDVHFSGRTANITYEIEEGTWVSQDIHEYSVLKTIYYIIKEGKADKINVTWIDYCKDSYGHINKRNWHNTIDNSWYYWNEVSKYADAGTFGNKLSKFYVLSSDTDEGTFYCCGRDRGCN